MMIPSVLPTHDEMKQIAQVCPDWYVSRRKAEFIHAGHWPASSTSQEDWLCYWRIIHREATRWCFHTHRAVNLEAVQIWIPDYKDYVCHLNGDILQMARKK